MSAEQLGHHGPKARDRRDAHAADIEALAAHLRGGAAWGFESLAAEAVRFLVDARGWRPGEN